MFWDPESTKKLLQSGLKLVMFPLDVTNKLPVDRNFLKEFAVQSNFPVSNLFSQMFAVSYFEDPQHFHDYFLWDVTAAGYFGAKDLFKYKKLEIDLITEGQDQGKTILKPGSGQWVNVALDIERDNFISFLKNLLRK